MTRIATCVVAVLMTLGSPATGATEAYLSGNRVKVTVTYRNPYNGETGTASVVPQGDEFTYFAFSSPANPEVFVKVLGSNDPNWFQLFAAGLTDFEYTATFSGCGQTKTFTQPAFGNVKYADGRGIASPGCAPYDPNEVTVTLAGAVPLTVVKNPAGTFQMGSPTTETNRGNDETLHAVTLTQDYYVAKYLVTQEQWQAVTGTPMRTACGSYGIGASYPAYCVSWNDIRGTGGFLEKLNAYLSQTGQPGAGKFRLPTEAEWERAARGGTQTRFSFGNALKEDDVCEANDEANPYVWWCYNASGTSQPVGTKLPNQYGLFDMHGNEFEWVEDWYGAYPTAPVTNPTGPPTGTNRVLRSGYFNFRLFNSRSAFRSSMGPAVFAFNFGFRPARSL